MFDITAIIIGFCLGVVVVALAIEMGIKKTTRDIPKSNHTDRWNISEITNPKINAEYLVDVNIPKGSKVVVNQYKDKDILKGIEARKNKNVKGNFILGDDRALILSGPIKKNEIGFWTVEEEVIVKLKKEFEENWTKGKTIKHEDKEES